VQLLPIKFAAASRFGLVRCLACSSGLLILLSTIGFPNVAALNGISLHSTTDPAGTRAAPSNMSVRSELDHLQKENGLTIGIVNYKGIGELLFRKRSFVYQKLVVDGNLTTGAVSRDGTEVALTQLVRKPASVIVMHPDGTDVREYTKLHANSLLCWSYDHSKLVVETSDPQIRLLDLKSKLVRDLDLASDVLLTSQCWSPDGSQIVFESKNENVFAYDLEKRNSTKLAKGTEPTWSPDGNWIAYRDDDTYYVIRPSGEGKRKLFHKRRAVSGLYWSPDSRFVAYVHQDFFAFDVEFYHLMVRRLQDGSETWFVDGEDAGAGYNYQWVINPQLLKQVELGTTTTR
jgi:Tol biopolymer transport system component